MVVQALMLLDKVTVPLMQHIPSFLVTTTLPEEITPPEKLVCLVLL